MSFRARFIQPMLLRQTAKLPEGAQWLYELKLDGYRAIAFKSDGRVHLRSRNDKDFAARYSAIASTLSALPMTRSSTAKLSPWTRQASLLSTFSRTTDHRKLPWSILSSTS